MLGFYDLFRGLLLLNIASLSMTLSQSLSFLPKQLGDIRPFLLLHALSTFLISINLSHMLSLQSSVLSHQPIDHMLVVIIIRMLGVLSTCLSLHLAVNLSSTISTLSTLSTFDTGRS